MDVSHWLAWSLVLIPIAGILTVGTLIFQDWQVRRDNRRVADTKTPS